MLVTIDFMDKDSPVDGSYQKKIDIPFIPTKGDILLLGALGDNSFEVVCMVAGRSFKETDGEVQINCTNWEDGKGGEIMQVLRLSPNWSKVC